MVDDSIIVEAKQANTANPDRVYDRVRGAREQSPNIFVDATGGGLSLEDAESVVDRVVSNPRVGANVDRVWIITAGGGVYWERAKPDDHSSRTRE